MVGEQLPGYAFTMSDHKQDGYLPPRSAMMVALPSHRPTRRLGLLITIRHHTTAFNGLNLHFHIPSVAIPALQSRCLVMLRKLSEAVSEAASAAM